MAKVSLRSYNREIETMVDRGEFDEAIAHCRHILNVFPKNLETYRLLGKAYLEAKRYGEATDIFERVLMAVPDDFVAHVGMSIIDDEQNNMDAAIWHMERAFEVQPSNAAIQAELQRLFGRRDGVEPPKVRLTRGALAHMYVQGELYPQAISEIKAVLDEDRERQDMQVLLARAYFHAGQKNEAAEICAQLLRRYPYCLEANRVLVELLPETERGESPQVYRNRVNELDPYATFTTGSIFRTEEVPDAAVSLERLDWDGQPVDTGQEWRDSLGIGRTDKTAAGGEEPDWLRTGLTPGSFSASMPTGEPASVSGGDDDIPDFLRDAGWGKDTGTFKESPGTFEAPEGSSEEPALAEGDLPDWIKAMAPTGAPVTPQDEMDEDLTQDDVPDWLQGLGDAQETSPQGQSLEDGDLPDWLAAMKPTGATPQESQPEETVLAEPGSDEDLPDWLAGLKPSSETPHEPQPTDEEIATPSADQEIFDWLEGMKAEDTASEAPQPMETVVAEPSGDESISEWLAEMKAGDVAAQEPQLEEEALAEPAGDEDIPDWLAGLKAVDDTPQEPQPDETVMAEPASDADLPDWITAMKPAEEVPQEPHLEEETVMAEPAGEEDLPDWLADLKAVDVTSQEPQPTEEVMAEPTGAEDVPDWLAGMQPGEAVPEETHSMETVIAEPTGEEDLPDWLRSIPSEEDQFAAQELPAETQQEPVQEFPEVGRESLADWQIGDEETAGPVAFDATDTGTLGTSAAEQDDAIAWLESLAAKHGAKPEELVTKPEERTEIEPEWVQQARAVKEHEAVEAPAPEEPAQAPSEEVPGFMAEMEVEPTEVPGAGVPGVDATVIGPSAAEQDDAIAWLESLAAKHGAKPEELVTDPNARKETAPEWVQKAAEAGSIAQPPAEEAAPLEEPLESIPEWIEPAKEEAGSLYPELEDTQPHKPISRADTDETGMWLRDLGEESGLVSEQEPAAEAEVPSMSMGEDVPDWLREMEAGPSHAEAGPTPEGEAQEVPDWLSGIEAEPSKMEEASLPSEEEAQAAPDWLSEIEVEPSQAEAGAIPEEATEEVPDWLLGVETDQTERERSIVFPSEEEITLEPAQEVVSRIDLNNASVEQIAELPGIGEFLAENIVAYREIYGPYSSVDDLNNIVGIDPPTIDGLRGRVEFHEVEAAAQADEVGITDWLKGVEVEHKETMAEETVFEETASDDLPSWLAGLDEEQAQPEPVAGADDDLPEWLRAVDEQEPVQAEPTAPADWRPAEIPTSFPEEPSEPVIELEPEVEETPVQAAPPPAMPEPEPEPEEPVISVEPQPEPYVEPVTRVRSGMTGTLSAGQDPVLTGAQLELTRGNVTGALESYEKLIRRGRMLDEIIFDLREALYRYPVDVSIMQALGDAYMRANRLQDALDAYTKAEELLR